MYKYTFFKKQRFLGKFFSTTGLKQEQPETDNCFQVKKRRVHFSLSEKSKRTGTCYKPKIENWEKNWGETGETIREIIETPWEIVDHSTLTLRLEGRGRSGFCYEALWKLWGEGRGLRWYHYVKLVKNSNDASFCCHCSLKKSTEEHFNKSTVFLSYFRAHMASICEKKKRSAEAQNKFIQNKRLYRISWRLKT